MKSTVPCINMKTTVFLVSGDVLDVLKKQVPPWACCSGVGSKSIELRVQKRCNSNTGRLITCVPGVDPSTAEQLLGWMWRSFYWIYGVDGKWLEIFHKEHHVCIYTHSVLVDERFDALRFQMAPRLGWVHFKRTVETCLWSFDIRYLNPQCYIVFPPDDLCSRPEALY